MNRESAPPIRFGSVCSGIEAASVAWHPLGWRAAWLSEIEPFPCAVLKHHYPDVPNLGDMTTIAPRILSGEVEAPDVFCGGTPCQAFSVAGNRKSLDDARGNLSLTFCEIANAIDAVRHAAGQQPAIIFWENVPGATSTKDNFFGCFLAELAGESVPLEPPGGKWTDAGCVLGPKRAVAWRTLDAQFFSVAQRRRRIFVCATQRGAGTVDPFQILFESNGLRRDSAPERKTRKAIAGDAARGAGVGGNELIAMSTGQGGAEIAFDNGPTLTCNHEAPILCAEISPTVTNGPPFSRTGNERVECEALVAVPVVGFENSRRDGVRVYDEGVTHTLQSFMGTGGGNTPCAAYCLQGSMVGRSDTAGPQGDGVNEEVSFTQNCVDRHAVAVPIAFTTEQTPKFNINQSLTLTQSEHKHNQCVATRYIVRRLTPTECERLQGFPDGYTNIPWRNKPEAPDGPRYKALGNSWAVPVVRWLGSRIDAAIRATDDIPW